eukprot:7963259-Prorocentrum_lima.AAC.1
MTSSLVGSEMCIRDRQAVEPQTHLWYTSDCRPMQLSQSMESPGTHANGCLLYTSDAADDM